MPRQRHVVDRDRWPAIDSRPRARLPIKVSRIHRSFREIASSLEAPVCDESGNHHDFVAVPVTSCGRRLDIRRIDP